MALEKGWRVILRFALLGFLIAELATLSFVAKAPNIIANLMTLASPGAWLFPVLAWHGGPNTAYLFVVAPILNGGLYAVFGALIVGLTTKSKH